MDRILSVDPGARCQLLLRILEKKGAKGLEALNGILKQRTLEKRTMNSIETEMRTTAVSSLEHLHHDHHEEVRHSLPLITRSESQVQQSMAPRGVMPNGRSSSRHQVLTGNIEQLSVTSNLQNIPDKRVQPWKEVNCSSDRISKGTQIHSGTASNCNGRIGAPGSDALPTSSDVIESTRNKHSSHVGSTNQRQFDEHNGQSEIRLPPCTMISRSASHSKSPQGIPISPLDTRPALATSTSVPYTAGLQQQELAFPRSQPKSQEYAAPTTSSGLSRETDTAQPFILSQTSVPDTKGDPEVYHHASFFFFSFFKVIVRITPVPY